MSNLSFYENGKIYKIVDNTNDNIYIGSTCKRLCQRMAQHRSNYKGYLDGKISYVSSFDILKNGSYDIILIENYPCKSKEELTKRERYYIESITCCNKSIPTRTKKEWDEDNIEQLKQYRKEYQKENSEHITVYQKEYKKENKEKLAEYHKEYQSNNKEIIKEQRKEYYEQNIDKFIQYNKTKINCICGNSICRSSKVRHERSKKHTDYILKQTL
jgi:hypothetical protein